MPGLLEYIYGEGGPFGKRPDGTNKGYGYHGLLNMLDGSGGKMTELTANMDGMDFPLIVPTMTRGELMHMQLGEQPTREMYLKALKHALKRKQQGLSVYSD